MARFALLLCTCTLFVQQVAKRNVLNNKELQQTFLDHVGTTDGGLATSLYREIVGRVINTMANSFFRCQDVLDRVAENRGVDAQVALRDKLKVYATDVRSKLFD